jgi:ubiquinone biosynthesis protein COQ4
MALVKKLVLFLRLGRSLFKIAKDPDDVSQFFLCSELLSRLGAFGQMEQVLRSSPEAVRLIERRTQLRPKELSEFLRKREGTLGRSFAEFLVLNGLDPNFYPPIEARTDADYVVLRMRQMHDIIHVITGFDASPEGELGLQGFLLGQMASPLSMILIGGAALTLPFHQQEKWVRYMTNISRGWTMGREARLCFGVDWDSLWDLPLEEVRRELGLGAGSAPSRDWRARQDLPAPPPA